MIEIFQELVKLSQASCAVCYSAAAQKILFDHCFEPGSKDGGQILRLLRRVTKIKEVEHCADVSLDPLFRAMGIRGGFVCYPLLCEEAMLGSLFLSSEDKRLVPERFRQMVNLLADAYYEKLRQETREEVESETQILSQRLRRYLSMGMSCGGKKIVGIDPLMEEQVFSCIEMYKSENCSPVLILGESGTGKELVASALHYRSERAKQIYLRFNCAEIRSADPQMQRIELFGCKAGIAPGVTERKGLFALADKGTLFLDEIGLLSLESQGHLLRVLEDSKVRPVGEKKEAEIDVRLICANNQPLQDLVKEGIFRKDLFYRICSFIINVPPLRQRGINDLDLLIDYFLEEENEKQLGNKRISMSARKLLHGHAWPGNVRELRATLRRAFYKVAKLDGVITEREVEFITHEGKQPIHGHETSALFPEPWQKLSDIEREAFVQATLWASQNPRERTQSKVAEMLGIHPNTMTRKLKEYEIHWPKSQ